MSGSWVVKKEPETGVEREGHSHYPSPEAKISHGSANTPSICRILLPHFYTVLFQKRKFSFFFYEEVFGLFHFYMSVYFSLESC